MDVDDDDDDAEEEEEDCDELSASEDENEMVGLATANKKAGILAQSKKNNTTFFKITPPKCVPNRTSCTAASKPAPKCSASSIPTSASTRTSSLAKPTVKSSIYDSVDFEDYNTPPVEGTTENGTPLTCPPFYWQWIYEDVSHSKHICICMCLPTGILRTKGEIRGEVVPTVSADGLSLSLRFQWPSFFTDLDLIQVGLENENIDRRSMLLMVFAADKELEAVREALCKSNHQGIATTSIISLPLEVEPTIEAFVPFFHKESERSFEEGEGSGGGAVIIMLKVREKKIGQLPYKSYKAKGIDHNRKDEYADNHGLWSMKK